jgi:hypothetical protein
MSRRGRQTKKPLPPKPTAPARLATRALAVIDEAPIRREAMATYERLESEIAGARAILEAFETGDLPAHQRWEARAFGPLLTEMRELTMEVQRKDMILQAIDDEMFFTGCSDLTAYRRVMKALEGPPPERDPRAGAGGDPDDDFGDDSADEPSFGPEGAMGDKMFGDSDLPPGFTAADFDRMSPAEKREFRKFYEATAELYEIVAGRIAPLLDDVLKAQRAGKRGADKQPPPNGKSAPEPEPEASPAKRAADRLKELYRKLVLQLHPDHHGEQTPRDRELWHQLQTAYKNKDLELMEALAGRIELTLNRLAGSLPVQILLRLTRELRESLRGLRAQINSAKQNPAWEFRKKSAKLPALESKRRKNLEHQLRKLRLDLDGLKSYLDALALRATRSKSKSKAKKQPAPAPEPKPRRARAGQSTFDFF